MMGIDNQVFDISFYTSAFSHEGDHASGQLELLATIHCYCFHINRSGLPLRMVPTVPTKTK